MKSASILSNYLEAVAASCLEAAAKPEPKMLSTIAGVLQMAADELKRNEAKLDKA